MIESTGDCAAGRDEMNEEHGLKKDQQRDPDPLREQRPKPLFSHGYTSGQDFDLCFSLCASSSEKATSAMLKRSEMINMGDAGS